MTRRRNWTGIVVEVLVVSLIGAPGCQLDKPAPFESSDADGDGFSVKYDCDDDDPNVYPSQAEACEDGIDNDCNDLIDLDDAVCQSPGGTSTVYDADGDGWALPDDCDDSNADVFPGAVEVCDDDQRDDDCGGSPESDQVGVEAAGCVGYMPDRDGDGQGAETEAQCLCVEPEPATAEYAWTTESGDCDDLEARAYAGAPVECSTQDIDDADCDGDSDPAPADCTLWYGDADGDGRGDPEDVVCDCEQPTGYVADASGCASTEMDTYYRDADGDGYGAEAAAPDDSPASRYLCEPLGVYTVLVSGDCDDDNPGIYPGAPDDCGGVDYDCDQVLDLDLDGDGISETASLDDEYGRTDAYDCVDFYRDTDHDGYGDEWDSECFCPDMDEEEGVIWPSADEATYDDYTSLVATDCDDDDDKTHPEAEESCDEEDNDCDDFIDEFAGTTFYDDEDGDNHGDPSSARRMCDWYAAAYGYVALGDDCDDDSSTSYPRPAPTSEDPIPWDEGTSGLCDGHDDDCDGEVDDGLTSLYYPDGDGDGHGDDDEDSVELCKDDHAGYVDSNDDCNDGNAYIHPDRTETCNGVDDNCDDIADDGLLLDYWPDDDGDLLGDSKASPESKCAAIVVGMVPNDDDCDDSTAYIGVKETYYTDGDHDGYGDTAAVGVLYCPSEVSAGDHLADNAMDCDDTNDKIHPGKGERCNNTDDNCDGDTDEGLDGAYWYKDVDGDGYGDSSTAKWACGVSGPGGGLTYVGIGGDCADSAGDEAINPGATEVCDGIDNDCDDETDTVAGSSEDLSGCCDVYVDSDVDTYGFGESAGCYCAAPEGFSLVDQDCADDDELQYPTSTEISSTSGLTLDCGMTSFTPSDYYHPTQAEADAMTPAGSACWLIPTGP